MKELARLVVHRGNDPFTPPRSKVEWTKGDWGLPSPTVRWAYMWSELVLIVEGPDLADVKRAVDEALAKSALKAAFAGAIVGYMSGGTAALSAAATVFIHQLDAEVEAILKRAVDMSYRVENDSHWGDYQ